MQAVFVETREFTRTLREYLDDVAYAKLQQELMDNPSRGTVIKGTGGLRKIRFVDPRRSKGKRSGARLIYLYLPDVKRFYLLDIYSKDEKVDLSAAECRQLSLLVDELKKSARQK